MKKLVAFKDAYLTRLREEIKGPAKGAFEDLRDEWRRVAKRMEVTDEDVLDFLVGFIMALPITALVFPGNFLTGDPIRQKTKAFLKAVGLEGFMDHFEEVLPWTVKQLRKSESGKD
jgi:hypothetical protein